MFKVPGNASRFNPFVRLSVYGLFFFIDVVSVGWKFAYVSLNNISTKGSSRIYFLKLRYALKMIPSNVFFLVDCTSEDFFIEYFLTHSFSVHSTDFTCLERHPTHRRMCGLGGVME